MVEGRTRVVGCNPSYGSSDKLPSIPKMPPGGRPDGGYVIHGSLRQYPAGCRFAITLVTCSLDVPGPSVRREATGHSYVKSCATGKNCRLPVTEVSRQQGKPGESLQIIPLPGSLEAVWFAWPPLTPLVRGILWRWEVGEGPLALTACSSSSITDLHLVKV